MKQWQRTHHHHHQATETLASAIETEVTAVEQAGPTVDKAGLEKIRAAIKLIETHSAARIGRSILFDALELLEEAYDIISKDPA